LIIASCVLGSVANAGIIFSESFDDNSNGWNESSGWDVVDGVYRFTSSDFHYQKKSYIAFGQVSAADLATGSYSFSYDARFTPGLVGFLMGGAWEDNAGNQNWARSQIEYAVDNSNFSYVPATMPSHTGLGTIGGVITLGVNEWHHIDINMDAGVTSYSVNGVELASGVTNLYSMDNIGFSSWRSTGEFDNLLIVKNDAQEVPEPSTFAIFTLGVMGLVLRRFKKQP